MSDSAATSDQAYLDENKNKEGVQVTESGLQYKVIESGNGPKPEEDHIVTVHYAGRLIDGTEFDSSYKRGEPAQFPAGRLIKGWTEALLLMSVGDKWELVIPSDIAYGDAGAGGVIPGGATLVFDIELLDTKSHREMHAEKMAAEENFKNAQFSWLDENANKEDVSVTDSGLQYKVLTQGEGKVPSATSQVTVHYEGKLITGDIFDSSYRRGETIQFGLNQVIPGWTEGLQLMNEGSTYELYIPHDIGYGERGSGASIPGYATLIFKVELVSVDS